MKNKYERIFVSGPDISSKEIEYVTEAVKTAWYDNANYYNIKFENNFKEYVGRKYAVALPSCTSAIHLGLVSLGVGPGDEVIVPDITWIASAAPINYVGATPVFVDIDENTWCIDTDSFEKSITERTKAVIIVDLYGGMCDMDRILDIAKINNIAVVEDSAQALGSEYKGKKAGSFGEISVFSFHGSKIVTTGEGGMLVTDDEKIYKRCLKLRDHGRAESTKMFWNDEIGFKYKMSSLQAALGIAQLERIEELVEKKREIYRWYHEELENIDGVSINSEPKGTKNNFWMVTVVWRYEKFNVKKEEVMEELKKFNIDSRPFFYPLSIEPAYDKFINGIDFSNYNFKSYEISQYAINLPCGMDMTKEKVKRVASCFKEILDKNKIIDHTKSSKSLTQIGLDFEA